MTRVTFFLSPDHKITAVDILGHAGYADEGEDIVCAAISSTVQLTHALLTDVRGIAADTLVEEGGAHIRISLPAEDLDAGQDGLLALRLFYTELAVEHSKFIHVLEVQNDA